MSTSFHLHVILREGSHYTPTKMDTAIIEDEIVRVAKKLQIRAEVHTEEVGSEQRAVGGYNEWGGTG